MTPPRRQPTPVEAAKAVEKARAMILRDYGTLDDLPAELQDTIAHIYYQISVSMQWGDGGGFANGLAGMAEMAEEAAFHVATVKHLPNMIRAVREDVIPSGNREGAETIFEYCILAFKYRIPNVNKMSSLMARIRKRFYTKYANEIRPGFYAGLMR
jgi:hypothetical protein